MPNYLLILVLLSSISCQSSEKLTSKTEYKTGLVSIREILTTSEKFKKGYDDYTPTRTADISDDYHFVIVFGFWCHDSKREIPRLLKTFELFGVDEKNIQIYATNRKKTIPKEIINKYEVFYSPTIIFFKGEKEIRRFVEFPDTTWELDLIKHCNAKE